MKLCTTTWVAILNSSLFESQVNELPSLTSVLVDMTCRPLPVGYIPYYKQRLVGGSKPGLTPQTNHTTASVGFCCYTTVKESIKTIHYTVNSPHLVHWVDTDCWFKGKNKNLHILWLPRIRDGSPALNCIQKNTFDGPNGSFSSSNILMFLCKHECL